MPGRKRQEEQAKRGPAQTARSSSPSQEDEGGGMEIGVPPAEVRPSPPREPAARAAEVGHRQALEEEALQKEGSQAPLLG